MGEKNYFSCKKIEKMKKLIKESLIKEETKYLEYWEWYKKYKELVSRKPWVKTIMEDILRASVSTQIYLIREDKRGDVEEVAFWFNHTGSLSAYLWKSEQVEMLLKHKVIIEFPGNQDYGFVISIKD